MDLLKLKLLMEQLQDITECINKVNKLQLIQLPVFLLGQEVFYIELHLIRMRSCKTSVRLLRDRLSKQLRMVL